MTNFTPKQTSPKTLKPPVHGSKKIHYLDRTEKKFFRNITNVQLELKKEMKNTNLRIEAVHKNVKSVKRHIFGIEIFGTIVFVAKTLLPIIRDYILRKRGHLMFSEPKMEVTNKSRKYGSMPYDEGRWKEEAKSARENDTQETE